MNRAAKDSEAMGAITTLIVVAVMVAAGIGWVLNLAEIAQIDGFSGMLVLRVIGIFIAPIGAVLGWV